jgi:hypothetical protein
VRPTGVPGGPRRPGAVTCASPPAARSPQGAQLLMNGTDPCLPRRSRAVYDGESVQSAGEVLRREAESTPRPLAQRAVGLPRGARIPDASRRRGRPPVGCPAEGLRVQGGPQSGRGSRRGPTINAPRKRVSRNHGDFSVLGHRRSAVCSDARPPTCTRPGRAGPRASGARGEPRRAGVPVGWPTDRRPSALPGADAGRWQPASSDGAATPQGQGRRPHMHLDTAAPQRVIEQDPRPTRRPADQATPQATKFQSSGAGNCSFVGCGEHRQLAADLEPRAPARAIQTAGATLAHHPREPSGRRTGPPPNRAPRRPPTPT